MEVCHGCFSYTACNWDHMHLLQPQTDFLPQRIGTTDMRRFFKAAGTVSELGWESKSLGLWTHHRGPFLGEDLDGRVCVYLGHQLSNRQVDFWAAGQEKLHGLSADRTVQNMKHLVGRRGLGSPLRLHPALPPQISDSVGYPILFPRRLTLSYTDPHNIFLVFLSPCNALSGSICILTASLQWLWLCMSLGEPQDFLHQSCPWRPSKFPVMCFCL